MSSEVEETVKRIVAHKGVQSVVIVDKEGIPIRTFPATMEHTMAVAHAALLVPLITKVRAAALLLLAVHRTATAPPTRPPARRARTHRARPHLFIFAVWCAAAQTKKFIKELDSTNDMTHMRIRSVKSEMLVYPEKDYFIVVSQSSAACDP